ncbi:HdeD family acid-resistance protein [Dactylosporangium sp. CA-233914]|uniref:HdeD family acid-resistance protein n=1 Tax=Dactylosporangium sp. CA-233914 TaxID=3239934 RepID=UPI003D8BA3B3
MAAFSWLHRHPAGATRAGNAEPFWHLLALGIVTVLFGIAVLAWPDETLNLLGLIAGVWLIVLGVMRAFAAFDRQRPTAARLMSGITAVVLLAAGIACLVNAGTGVLVLAVIIGLAWLLSGFAELAVALLATGAVRAWLTVVAVVSILAGVAFLVWPTPSLRTLVLLTGISALLIGAAEVASALRMRRGREVAAAHSP